MDETAEVTESYNSELLTRFAAYAKALGHPARAQIIAFLAERTDCTCTPIVDAIGLAQSTVSQHLKVLKDSGLIQGTIDGKNTCYCCDHEALAEFKELTNQLTQIKQTKETAGCSAEGGHNDCCP